MAQSQQEISAMSKGSLNCIRMVTYFLASGLLVNSAIALAQQPAKKQPGAKPAATAPARFRLSEQTPYLGQIVNVAADGALTVERFAGGPGGPPAELTEGYYLGLAMPELKMPFEKATLVRAQVAEVGPEGAASVRLAKGAAGLVKPGQVLILVRPLGVTTAQLKAVPDAAPLVMGQGNAEEQAQSAAMFRSMNNLRQIGIAMHNFLDTYKAFPPAVVIGPDGRPWHSWRVLILPYLEQQALYQQYRFDEPWDGPNNSQLLDKMPAVYADPVYGPPQGDFTNYAAVVGPGMAFRPEGVKFDGQLPALFQAIGKRQGSTSISDFVDGTSNSLLVGSVSPEAKIPWTKPADIEVGEKFVGIGRPGGFAAPFEGPEGAAGMFLFADGAVRAIGANIQADLLRKLLTIGGNEVIDQDQIPTLTPPGGEAGQVTPVIEIVRGSKGPQAIWKMEPIPVQDELPPPQLRAPAPAPAPAPPPSP
jgi:hypothetical protein